VIARERPFQGQRHDLTHSVLGGRSHRVNQAFSEGLLADAKQSADHYREQARRAVDEASRQRTKILEQLMGVHRDLETVPAALESAYQEQKNPPEASRAEPVDQKVSTG
jgi:hypothetical protein